MGFRKSLNEAPLTSDGVYAGAAAQQEQRKYRHHTADLPSGKAQDFDSCIRWFKSNIGCQSREIVCPYLTRWLTPK